MSWTKAETEIYELALANVADNNKALARMYLKAQKDIADKLKQFFLTVDPSSSKQYQAQRLSEIFKEINKRLALLSKLTTKQIETAYLDQYQEVFNSYDYNLGKYFDLLPLEVVSEATIMKTLSEPIGNYNFKQFSIYARKKLTDDLREQVAISIAKGENPRLLAKRLDKIFGESIARTTATSRTEMLRAYSLSQEEAINQAVELGIEFIYIWRSTSDSRTRESHVRMNGKKAAIVNDKPVFTVGQSKGSSPRLLKGADQAAQCVNCRCVRINIPQTT